MNARRALLATLIGCAGCGPPAAGAASPRLRAEVAFSPGAPPAVAVTLTAAADVVAALEPPGDAAGAQVLAVDRKDAGDAFGDGTPTVSLAYVLALSAPDADVGDLERVGRSRPTGAGWVLWGATFLPMPGAGSEGPVVDLRFTLPRGWRLRSSLHYLPLDATGPLRATAAAAQAAVYAIGELAARDVVAGGTTVELASGDFGGEELEALAEIAEEAQARLAELFGGPLPARRLLLVDRGRAFAASPIHGEGRALLTPGPLGTTRDATRALVELLVTVRLAHLHPELRSAVRDYATELALAQLHGDEGAALAAVLSGCTDPHCGAAPPARLRAFCADVTLRATSDALPRRLAQLSFGAGRAELLAAIAATDPATAAEVDRALGTGPLDVGACLEHAGYAVRLSDTGIEARGSAPPGSPLRP